MKATTTKFETFLPLFTGFYETNFEPDESNEIESVNDIREIEGLNPIAFDQFQFDYSDYSLEISKRCTSFLNDELTKLGFVTAINFQKLVSPKEYNFSNDSINVEIELSKKNIKAINAFLKANIDEFEYFLKQTYTSCSGFISFHSTTPKEWFPNEWIENPKHKLGAILGFICIMNEITEDDLLTACEGIYISCSNYEDLTEKQFCPLCKSFVTVKNFTGNCCKNCENEQKETFEIIVCSKCGNEIKNQWEKRQFSVKLANKDILYKNIVCSDCNCML